MRNELQQIGKEWLNNIPTHWKKERLKDVCERVVGGGTPKSSISEYWDGGDIIWVSPTDFSAQNGNKFITESAKKITKLGMQKSSATLIPKGTVVMSSRASIGEPKIAGCDITTNQGFVSYVPSFKIDSNFLFYLIEGQLGEYFANIASGTTFMEITRRQAKNEPIPLPPLPEQKAIADYLDKVCQRIDKIIDIKQKQLKKIEWYFFSRLDSILTCKNITNKNSRVFENFIKRDIPEDWTTDRLKDVAIINDKALSSNTSPDYKFQYLDISNVNKYGIVEIDNIKEMTFEEAPSRARRVSRKHDTVLSSVRTNLQAVAFLETDIENLICSTGFFVCRPKFTCKLRPKFLYYFLLTAYSRDYFFSYSTGVSYPAINDYKFGSINIFYPKVAVQDQIIKQLDELHKKVNENIEIVKKEIINFQAYRKSIIHECVTGKKQVWEGEIEKEN